MPLLYLPVATTLLALPFAVLLVVRSAQLAWRRHLLWWGIGVACYGLGTALESWIALAGNSAAASKAWYVAGAVFGALPLAQGTAHLLLRPAWARRLTLLLLPWVLLLALLVLLSPVREDRLDPLRPGGDVLGWQWLRWATPLINGYAAAMLVGGAVGSALRWRRLPGGGPRALGNALIALGALLPAIGGGLAKAGRVEALYVAELCGLLLIVAGYFCCRRG